MPLLLFIDSCSCFVVKAKSGQSGQSGTILEYVCVYSVPVRVVRTHSQRKHENTACSADVPNFAAGERANSIIEPKYVLGDEMGR